MNIEYGVLGPLRVRRGSLNLDIGTPKQRAFLSLLLLHRNTSVPVDRIVDELWESDPPGSAIANIRSYANRMRRILTAEGMCPEPAWHAGGYLLDVAEDHLDL